MYFRDGWKTQLVCAIINHVLGKNRIKKRDRGGNTVLWKFAKCYRCVIDIRGAGNIVEIGSSSTLRDCEISIVGNNNRVSIGEGCGIYNVGFMIAGDGDSISIGSRSNFFCGDGRGIVAAGYGSKIEVGEECLFAPGIIMRSQDAHAVIDLENNAKLNSPKDIVLEKHVWAANRVIVLKGSQIGQGAVIGAGAVIANKHIPANSLIIGNPPRIVKNNITWNMSL